MTGRRIKQKLINTHKNLVRKKLPISIVSPTPINTHTLCGIVITHIHLIRIFASKKPMVCD